MTSGTTTADQEEDPFAEDRAPELVTGTAFDEFLPIYRSLARWTDRHGPMAQEQVDGMDITVVAALLGVGASADTFEAIAAEWQASYAAEVAAFEKDRATAHAPA